MSEIEAQTNRDAKFGRLLSDLGFVIHTTMRRKNQTVRANLGEKTTLRQISDMLADSGDELRVSSAEFDKALAEGEINPIYDAAPPASKGDWVLVPREPTEEMRSAWREAKPESAVHEEREGGIVWSAPYIDGFNAKYKAMIKAAPPAKTEIDLEELEEAIHDAESPHLTGGINNFQFSSILKAARAYLNQQTGNGA